MNNLFNSLPYWMKIIIITEAVILTIGIGGFFIFWTIVRRQYNKVWKR